MLYRLFRLPPLVYFIAAALVLALGVFLYFEETGKASERAAALSHEAPAEIALADIKGETSGSDYNEIVVRAQGDLVNTIEMVRTKRGSERGRKVFMPLFPADAPDFTGQALGVMQVDSALSDQELERMYVADGPAGPVFLINGTLEGINSSEALEALSPHVSLAPGFHTVKPFLGGREAALSEEGMGSILLILGLVLAGLLGGYGFLRKRHLGKQREAEEAEYAEYAQT